jgi:predicted component of type VI protein secretion system
MPLKKEKSQIDSFNVSLGPSSPIKSKTTQLEPWNILVCSDLGFVSKKPQQVRIAEWNEFVGAQGIVLSGSVNSMLFNSGKPLFIEYPVKTMKDFSAESVLANVPAFAAWSRTCSALQQLLDGKTSREEAVSMIGKASLPAEEYSRIMRLLETHTGKKPEKPAASPASKPAVSSVDKILSMVDVKPLPGKGPDNSPSSLTDALFQSVSGGAEQVDKAGISVYVAQCRQKLQEQTATVMAQDFFKGRFSSWQGLTQLAKVIGRKKEMTVSVVSSPAQTMQDRLGEALGACMEAGAAPDVIVWDYDVTFTNASMETMAALAAAAEKYKCMVVAPLCMDDPLLTGISGRKSVVHFFDDLRFLPYKKLRENTAARCLCLCAPSLAANEAKSEWFAAIRWAEMIIGDCDPFAAKQQRRPAESVFSGAPVFSPAVSTGVSVEAAAMGLTLFEETLEKAALDKAVTVAGPDSVSERYTSFCFNLLVNRVARLSGIKILLCGLQKNKEEIAAVLEEFLEKELSACGISASGKSVSVTVENNEAIVIEINSDVTVSGHPARFTFTI